MCSPRGISWCPRWCNFPFRMCTRPQQEMFSRPSDQISPEEMSGCQNNACSNNMWIKATCLPQSPFSPGIYLHRGYAIMFVFKFASHFKFQNWNFVKNAFHSSFLSRMNINIFKCCFVSMCCGYPVARIWIVWNEENELKKTTTQLHLVWEDGHRQRHCSYPRRPSLHLYLCHHHFKSIITLKNNHVHHSHRWFDGFFFNAIRLCFCVNISYWYATMCFCKSFMHLINNDTSAMWFHYGQSAGLCFHTSPSLHFN